MLVGAESFRAIYNGKYDPKNTCIDNNLFNSSKLNFSVWSRSRLETEPTQIDQSSSRLRDLGLLEGAVQKSGDSATLD